MLHELIGRLAAAGGELALTAIGLASIIGCAIVADRLWWFFGRAVPPTDVATRIEPHLNTSDWQGAALLLEADQATPAATAFAVLAHADCPAAARAHLRAAIARERLSLGQYLNILQGLAVLVIVTGLAGSACDFRELARHASTVDAAPQPTQQLFGLALAPATAGLIAAVPLWLAGMLLRDRVQRTLLHAEALAEHLLGRIASARPLEAGDLSASLQTAA